MQNLSAGWAECAYNSLYGWTAESYSPLINFFGYCPSLVNGISVVLLISSIAKFEVTLRN